MRTRRVTVEVALVTVEKSWSSASLTFRDSSGPGDPREAVINIDRPSDIQYIREKLNEIVKAWKQELTNIGETHS